MIARALYAFSARLRCRLIDIEGEPYLERYWLGRLGGFTAYLHRFVASDGDRNVHDHPWGHSLSLVLCGGYTEERLLSFCPDAGWLSTYRRLRAGSLNRIGERDFHRITEVQPETWTLFIHGPRVKSWGFLMRIVDAHAVLYHQPIDAAASAGWHLRAPVGADVPRQPFGGERAPAVVAAR